VERECLEAIYALQDVRGQRANRTWEAIKCHGIIGTVERVVTRPQVSEGFKMPEEAGLKDYAFENVVLRHPESFSAEISLRLFSAVPDYASVPAPYS
jgi:hypothetical protein